MSLLLNKTCNHLYRTQQCQTCRFYSRRLRRVHVGTPTTPTRRAAGTPHAHVTRKPMECSGTLTGHWHQPRPHTHTDITTGRDKCAKNVDQEPWDLFTDDLWWDATDFSCPRLFEACWYEKASEEEQTTC